LALVPGTYLGPYELTAHIGAGGMGEVYQATDTNLKRRVAIKVLPPAVATDPDRLARFRREAQVLASLNHPHIAQIYGLEEASGTPFLVLELVDGESLDQRIARGPIRVEEALRIALQIAEGLEAAHEAGIVHRDLKPANINVRPDDTVKVLDFGLAKASGPDVPSSNSELLTLTSPAMTQMGMILGTAAYMAPEQAKGRPVDRRADVWAFGAVLYEMVTGSRAFTGDTITEVIASVLARDPDWSKLPADASAINGVIRRCLERDPRQRFGDMQSVRLALTGAFAVAPAVSASVPVNAARPGATVARARSTVIAWGVALVAMVAALALGIANMMRPAPDQAVVRSSILPPPNVAFDFDLTVGPAVISPDGKLIAFSGRDAANRIQLWVRPIDSTDARPLAGTDGASFPFWSPDSRAIGFYSAARGRLERVDLAGGAPIAIVRAGYVRGASWTPDGAVLYDTSTGGGQIMEVAIAGGSPRSVIRHSETEEFGGISRMPWLLPDGRHFLYSNRSKREIHVASRDGSSDKMLTDSSSQAIYADGHLIFMRENTLLAQPFDLASLTLTGSSIAIARDVQSVTGDGRGVFSASTTGTLLYLDGASTSSTTLAWFDGNGKHVDTVGDLGSSARGVRLSPDGRSAALTLLDPDGGPTIWTVDLATHTRNQLTFARDPAGSFLTWSPDGRTLAYAASRDTGFVIAQRSAAGGEEQILFTLRRDQSRSDSPRVTAWTNDGSAILYSGTNQGGVWRLPLAPDPSGERSAQLLVKGVGQNVHLAPNQRWMSYQGAPDVGSIPQVFVESFPDGGHRQQVSARGTLPLWGADGKSLYYADDNMLTVLSVTEADGALQFGPPRAIMPIIVGRGFSYDVAKDGRILALVASEAAGTRPLTLVQNWAKAAGSR
jgi:Tol biopolymer transport system component